ncbi:MAG: 4Fe-4S dicluster domain-containing protein [Ardenticatenaceae bacterium]|nr:4Fe-4S dicluster domain-containing protein [Ardenticatenaceae bacterium]
MSNQIPTPGKNVVVAKDDLRQIIASLRAANYTVVGPTIQEEAIVYDELSSVNDLPIGWQDMQNPGSYRLEKENNGRYFDYVVGPQSWKKFLYPAKLSLFKTHRNENGFEVETDKDIPQYAFIGARGCELAAIRIQDHIFLEGAFTESHYKARRERAFILAVNCTSPGNTCFCVSMKTGPQVSGDYDLALTELDDTFLLHVGSEIGAEMLANCDWRLAGAFELSHARRLMAEAEEQMGRKLDTRDLPDLLFENLDHPQWDDVANRCLSCMNCTMVCPTCFCSDVKDISDLTGQNTERVRIWDSCFNPDFSYVFGGNLRPNIRARYRQWLTHKLASWVDQFGMLGCVGCGRCITWCPVGIDLTEEVAAIRGGKES